MKIRPKNIPKFLTGYWFPNLTYKGFETPSFSKNYNDMFLEYFNTTTPNKILTMNPKGNNIYFNGDWKNYNDWHSLNIVLPWLNKLQEQPKDWETLIKDTLDSWSNAGGFEWYNATDELRKHTMQSKGTFEHQNLYDTDKLLKEQDNIIGSDSNRAMYNVPPSANSADYFVNGTRTGRNGEKSDNYFGIQTGNRRPTIHINTNADLTSQWDDYFRKQGYVGKYQYLDHWVPTKDPNKAKVRFFSKYGEIESKLTPPQEGINGKLNLDLVEDDRITKIETGHDDGDDKVKFKNSLQKIFGNPNLWAVGRLAGNLINNARVYDELLKGISPVLRQTYNTHRQVVGDEAIKLAYYRRAAQGQTKAARAFTSDADRLVAYMNEAKRVGDELRAQGDLADNQEIRRTSDESNQHQWANILRATEVANANLASMNQANALKHNLLAQKHSAQWSSIDNFLKEIEYRKRQLMAEDLAIEDLIYALDLDDFKYTPEYAQAYEKYNNVLKQHIKPDNTYDLNHPDVIKARGEFFNFIKELKKQQLLNLLEYRRKRNNYKSGGKVTHKKKDDLLYKSTKDVVEHFRKMSKMSSDALNRKNSKIEKLTPHPKGTKKYQQGGVAPFTVYTPVAMGGETTRSSQYDSSSSKSSKSDNEGKETLDLMKSLFEKMLGKGLPIDVNAIYSQMNSLFSRYKAFGNELDTNDIALLYLQSMQSLNNAMYSKEVYDKAKAYATQNDSLNEFAVNALGHFVVQDTETGKLSTEKSWKDVLKSGKNPITNLLLLYLRSYSPELVSLKGDALIENVINNGMGINKIGAQIKALAGNIGSYEGKIEGLTQVESNKVKQGLQLLANAPDGYYKHTVEDKNLQTQIKAAISYITNMLSPSLRAILDSHGGADKLIPLFLASQENITHNVSFSPLTGKAAKEDENSLEKISSNPLLAMQREIGGIPLRYNIVTRDSTTRMSVNGTFYPTLPKIKDDTSIDNMLYESGIAGIMDNKNGITFGDLQVAPEDLKNIMYSNKGGIIVTLPCKIVNGYKLVNLEVKDLYEEAEQAALNAVGNNKNSDQFTKKLGEELLMKHLDLLLDLNGLPNKNMFGQFLVVEAYATDDIKLNENSLYIEKVKDPDEKLEKRLSKALSTDSKKSDYKIDVKDKWLLFEWGYNNIYRGTVFIPLNQNPNSAMIGWGTSTKIGQQQDLEELYLIENKSIKYNDDNKLN